MGGISHDRLQDVLKGNDPRGATLFVYDERQVDPSVPEPLQPK